MTPAEAYVRSLGPGYYLLSEVADKVGVASQTLRRLIKDPNKKIHAPSFVGNQGLMDIYVFTEDDVREIAAHYKSRYEGFEKRDLERGPGRPKSKKVK
jgi:hypothetical protein